MVFGFFNVLSCYFFLSYHNISAAEKCNFFTGHLCSCTDYCFAIKGRHKSRPFFEICHYAYFLSVQLTCKLRYMLDFVPRNFTVTKSPITMPQATKSFDQLYSALSDFVVDLQPICAKSVPFKAPQAMPNMICKFISVIQKPSATISTSSLL